MIKKISLYIYCEQSPSSYYRILQYFRSMDGVSLSTSCFVSNKMYSKYFPIINRGPFVKFFVFFTIYFRTLFSLLHDSFIRPDYIVICRQFVPRYMPLLHKLLVNHLFRRGVLFIWDFDDNILASGQISGKDFDLLARISYKIVVTHDFLKSQIPEPFLHKVITMPTTDGDMYIRYNDTIHNARMASFEKEVHLIWVGTMTNLVFLSSIIPCLDNAASMLKLRLNKTLILTVVSNGTLDSHPSSLVINNVTWSREVAIHHMLHSHIGIMPLEDNEYTKGKGGFKLVQYLSVGLPVIGSDVGFNKNIIDDDCGILVTDFSPDSWTDAILDITATTEVWSRYSQGSFKKWHDNFGFNKNLEVWKELVK